MEILKSHFPLASNNLGQCNRDFLNACFHMSRFFRIQFILIISHFLFLQISVRAQSDELVSQAHATNASCFLKSPTNYLIVDASIQSRLRYDTHISPECLNSVADYLIESRQHIQAMLDAMPPSLKTNRDLLLSLTNNMYLGWMDYVEIAGRPEMDSQLFEKCLAQSALDRQKYPYGVGGEFIDRTLARNPATPLYYLERLSTNASFQIQLGVVCNPNLPTNILWGIISRSEQIISDQNKLRDSDKDAWTINNLNNIIAEAHRRAARVAFGISTNAPTLPR